MEWRLLRIPTLESGLLAVGRKRFANSHPDEPEEIRVVLIEAEVQLEFQKPLANLALQESRLNRQHERELEKLTTLQTARRKLESARLEEAARFYMDCQENSRPFFLNDLHLFGFEISLEQIHRRVAHHRAVKDRFPWPTIGANYHFYDLQKGA